MKAYQFTTSETHYIIADSFKNACLCFFEDGEDEEQLESDGGFEVELVPEDKLEEIEIFNEDTNQNETLKQILDSGETGIIGSTID